MLRRALPLAIIIAGLATPALAELAQGRWECVAYGAVPATDPNAPAPTPPAGAPTDPATGQPILMPTGIAPDIPHGLLTIYGTSYTYASRTPGDPASGSGDVDQQDGFATFTNGPLREAAGVSAAKVETGAGTPTLDLIGETGPLFTCTAR